jgi:hypothetical protein
MYVLVVLDGHYSTSHLDQLRLKCSTHTKVEIKVEILILVIAKK